MRTHLLQGPSQELQKTHQELVDSVNRTVQQANCAVEIRVRSHTFTNV
jgi:hypothetical protein